MFLLRHYILYHHFLKVTSVWGKINLANFKKNVIIVVRNNKDDKKRRNSKMTKKKKILKISFVVFMILLCIALTVFVLLPFIKLLATDEGRIIIQQKVESFGIFAPVLYVLMEVTHIVLAFIPGGPVEIIGGVLFGAFWGLVLCEIGIFFATVIIYNLVKKFGRPLVNAFVSEEKFKKFKFLHDEKKLELIVFIILMIPGTPKDVISYMTSLTDINRYRFYTIATLARIPSVTSSAFMGATLGEGKPIITVIIFLATAVVGIAGIFLSNYITNSRQKKSMEKGDK